MTAREISEACGEHQRASHWARSKLRAMARHGLVRIVGSTLQNAHTWTITDHGRAVVVALKRGAGTTEYEEALVLRQG